MADIVADGFQPMNASAVSTSTVSASSASTLHVFHVDFIDTPAFHTRMQEILEGGHGAQPAYTSTSQGPEEGGISRVSISLIIPLCTISFFMLVIGVCLMCHASIRKRRRGAPARTPSNTYRTSVDWADPERPPSSMRENRLASVTKENAKLKLEKIKEVTETRFDDAMFSPTDSLVSYISNLRLDFPPILERQQTHSPRHIGEVSHSYPNLILSAQAPFSPYHITWITPNPDQIKVARSDPYALNMLAHRPERRETAPRVLQQPPNPVEEPAFHGRPQMNYTNSWKSPYYPNHNTPNGSESESVPMPPNVYLNRAATVATDPPPPYSPNDTPGTCSTGRTPRSTPVLAMVREASTLTNARLSRTTSRSSPSIVAGANPEAAAAAQSCPSEVGQWQYHRMFSMPETADTRAMYEEALLNLHHGRYPPPGHCEAPVCEVCNMCMMKENSSMNPLAGSYGNSVYQGATGPSTNTSYQGFFSANGSMVAHMDSGETTTYDSSGGAQPSEQSHSGYEAQPSHSTSIGVPSTNSSCLQFGHHYMHHHHHHHSNGAIQGISAIKQASVSTVHDQDYDSLMSTTKSAPAGLTMPRPAADTTESEGRYPPSVSFHRVGYTSSMSQETGSTIKVDKAESADGGHQAEACADLDVSCASKTDSSIRSVMLSPYDPPIQHPEQLRGESDDQETKTSYTQSSNSAPSYSWDVYPFADASQERHAGPNREHGGAAAGDTPGGENHLHRSSPRRRSGQPMLMDRKYWV